MLHLCRSVSVSRVRSQLNLRAVLALGFVHFLSWHALADTASQQAINASPAQLAALGLPAVPTGNNIGIAVLEVANGIPELSPANANMPTAAQVNIVVGGGVLGNHATTVTGTIVQRTPGGPPHAAIAPNATIDHSPATTYYDAISRSQNMLKTSAGGNGDGILNWSWHRTNNVPSDGTTIENLWLDWAVIPGSAAPPVQDEIIVVAGNESAANSRFSPWDNFNGITVGATSVNNYRGLAQYNGQATGAIGTQNITTDASPYGNGRVGRYKTDIVAPGGGDGVVLAAPVIRNGGVEPLLGQVLDTDNDGLNNNGNWGGTSFAAPHVTGAAALLRDFGTTQNLSTNEMVVKSILLNGASTTGLTDRAGNPYAPVGTLPQTKSNGGAPQPIFVGWDADLGTGLLDVGHSLQQYNAGEFNPGNVPLVGWDLNSVGLSGDGALTREYMFAEPAGIRSIRTTLAWNRLVNLGDKAQTGFTSGLWDTEDLDFSGTFNGAEVDVDGDGNLDVEQLTAMTLNDLDLELWNLTLNQRVYFSSSDMDSVEHFDWSVPQAMWGDDFSLRVTRFRQFGPSDDPFAVSWWATAVPEPSTLALFVSAAFALVGVRRRRRVAP